MSYIGNQPTQVAFLTDQFSGNASTTAFTMSVAPANTASVLVAITGVVQDPSTYSVVGTTLTFSAAPPTGNGNISVRYLGIPASGVTTTAYRTVTEFTATAGQTLFTPPSYTVGYINVYRNGVLLASADYTATNGTTVTLNNACTVNDIVTTESFYVSSVLNALPLSGGTVSGNTIFQSTVAAGGGTVLGGATNPIVAMAKGATSYVQSYIINNTNGTSSSADVVAYPSNGTDSHGWVDMGITSQAYADSTYTVTGPNESYLFGSAPSGSGTTGNLVIATDNTGTANSIQFYTGGFTQAKSAAKMVIDGATGNVGIGTSSPSYKLDVLSSTANSVHWKQLGTTNGDGFLYSDNNGSGIYDTAGGSGNGMYLYKTGNAIWWNTNATERMRIDSSGNLLVGSTSLAFAGTRFSVVGTTGAGTGVMSSVNGGANTKPWHYGPDGNGNFIIFNGSSVGAYLGYGNTTWTANASDERLKNKVGDIENALEAVSKLNPLTYYLKDEPQTGTPRYGFFAQNVGEAIPDAMVVSPIQSEELGDVFTYNAEIINVYLVKAIQEQQAIIQQLQADVAALKGQA